MERGAKAMVRRLLKGLCVSAACALVATVAVQRVAVAAEQVTLHWLEWWDPEWGVDVMDGLTKKFEEKTRIKVELFKKAGMEPHKIWNDVLDSAKKLNASGVVANGLGVTFGDSSILYPMYYLFGARLAQLGGRLYDDSGHAVFNSPEGVAALEWWKDLYKSGLVAENSFGITWTQQREDFATGKIAAMLGGPVQGTIAKQV